MKANIKRKKVVDALSYMGLNYIAGLVERKEVLLFDDSFFEALVKEMDKAKVSNKKLFDDSLSLRNAMGILQKKYDELNNKFCIYQNDKRLEIEDLNEKIENLNVELNFVIASKNVDKQPKTNTFFNGQVNELVDLFNVPKE